MTKEQAINYLKSSGFSDEQIEAVTEAFSEEHKTGRWIHTHGDEWYCSVCLYTISTEGSWEHPKDTGKDFCEHCGAKMEGSDSDEAEHKR